MQQERRRRKRNYFETAKKKRNMLNGEQEQEIKAHHPHHKQTTNSPLKQSSSSLFWQDTQSQSQPQFTIEPTQEKQQMVKKQKLQKKDSMKVETLIFEQQSQSSSQPQPLIQPNISSQDEEYALSSTHEDQPNIKHTNNVSLSNMNNQLQQNNSQFNIVTFINTRIQTVQSMKFKIYRDTEWMNKFRPLFTLNLQEKQSFVMACKQMSSDTFVFSYSSTDFQENGNSYIGKMKSNFSGTIVNIFGEGLNPKNAKEKIVMPRQLLATVTYEQAILKQAKPRDFKVFVKKPNVNYYKDLVGVQLYEEQVPLNQLHFHHQNQDKIIMLSNRQGKWNEKVECYTLNMKKRAKKASIKNFILEDPKNPNVDSLLLGKDSQNIFNLDMSFPMSPFLGFSIGLTTFISKIGC